MWQDQKINCMVTRRYLSNLLKGLTCNPSSSSPSISSTHLFFLPFRWFSNLLKGLDCTTKSNFPSTNSSRLFCLHFRKLVNPLKVSIVTYQLVSLSISSSHLFFLFLRHMYRSWRICLTSRCLPISLQVCLCFSISFRTSIARYDRDRSA